MTALQISAYFTERPWMFLFDVSPGSNPAARAANSANLTGDPALGLDAFKTFDRQTPKIDAQCQRRTSIFAAWSSTYRASTNASDFPASGNSRSSWYNGRPRPTAGFVRAIHRPFCLARCSCLPIVMSVRRFPTTLVSLQSITFTTSMNVMAITLVL